MVDVVKEDEAGAIFLFDSEALVRVGICRAATSKAQESQPALHQQSSSRKNCK